MHLFYYTVKVSDPNSANNRVSRLLIHPQVYLFPFYFILQFLTRYDPFRVGWSCLYWKVIQEFVLKLGTTFQWWINDTSYILWEVAEKFLAWSRRPPPMPPTKKNNKVNSDIVSWIHDWWVNALVLVFFIIKTQL